MREREKSVDRHTCDLSVTCGHYLMELSITAASNKRTVIISDSVPYHRSPVTDEPLCTLTHTHTTEFTCITLTNGLALI